MWWKFLSSLKPIGLSALLTYSPMAPTIPTILPSLSGLVQGPQQGTQQGPGQGPQQGHGSQQDVYDNMRSSSHSAHCGDGKDKNSNNNSNSNNNNDNRDIPMGTSNQNNQTSGQVIKPNKTFTDQKNKENNDKNFNFLSSCRSPIIRNSSSTNTIFPDPVGLVRTTEFQAKDHEMTEEKNDNHKNKDRSNCKDYYERSHENNHSSNFPKNFSGITLGSSGSELNRSTSKMRNKTRSKEWRNGTSKGMFFTSQEDRTMEASL